MSDLQKMAAALYGGTPSPAPTSAPGRSLQPAPAPTPSDAGKPLSDVQEAQVTPASEPSVIAESIFDGGDAITSSAAHTTIGAAFNTLEQQAREDRDELQTRLYSEGRTAAAEAMESLGVGAAAAREITSALQPYLSREPQSDAELAGGLDKAAATLRQQWPGDAYDRNLADARLGYQEAASRLWWLSALVSQGAGNDPQVVAFFAGVGAKLRRSGNRTRG